MKDAMTNRMQQTMQAAMRLMQQGDLQSATLALQRGLQGHAEDATSPEASAHAAPIDLEAQYRVVVDEPLEPSADAPLHRNARDAATFRDARFTCPLGSLDYKLFVPAGLAEDARPPLLLMLHGCTQTPDDFARGTRMNTVAQEHGYVVAYPAQAQRNNTSKCWNWFRAQDQQRDRGEGALLAALAQHLVDTQGLDARRVYAAGLSAGGAMAAVLAHTHADVFAAVGVHSGLPFGSAHDVPTAFAAMKSGRRGRHSEGTGKLRVIVFHGDSDTTVNACNGDALIAQFARDHPSPVEQRAPTVERGSTQGGRAFTRRVFTDTAGNVTAEQWTLHGAGHAWSGGDATGSYTDPSGPDASAQMVRFFSACANASLN